MFYNTFLLEDAPANPWTKRRLSFDECPLMFGEASTDGCPVDVGFAERLELAPEDVIFWPLAVGVVVYHTLSHLAHVLQKLPVAGDVRNFQVEGDAALLGKPSLVRTMISNRLRVSSASL